MGPGTLSLTSSHVMLLVPDAHGKRIPLARTPKLSYRICDCFPGVVGSLPCLTLQSLSVVGREPALQKNSPPRTLPRQEVPLKETILTPGGVPVTILALNGMKRPRLPGQGQHGCPWQHSPMAGGAQEAQGHKAPWKERWREVTGGTSPHPGRAACWPRDRDSHFPSRGTGFCMRSYPPSSAVCKPRALL